MPDSSQPVVCCIYPLKNGWKILKDNVRIGLASSREAAINKIMKLSANLGVLYRVRIYKEDGRLEKETICFSPREPSRISEFCPPAVPEAELENAVSDPNISAMKNRQDNMEVGLSFRKRIALLAYSYWEKRGCQGGSPEEDWLRAEQEIMGQHHA